MPLRDNYADIQKLLKEQQDRNDAAAAKNEANWNMALGGVNNAVSNFNNNPLMQQANTNALNLARNPEAINDQMQQQIQNRQSNLTNAAMNSQQAQLRGQLAERGQLGGSAETLAMNRLSQMRQDTLADKSAELDVQRANQRNADIMNATQLAAGLAGQTYGVQGGAAATIMGNLPQYLPDDITGQLALLQNFGQGGGGYGGGATSGQYQGSGVGQGGATGGMSGGNGMTLEQLQAIQGSTQLSGHNNSYPTTGGTINGINYVNQGFNAQGTGSGGFTSRPRVPANTNVPQVFQNQGGFDGTGPTQGLAADGVNTVNYATGSQTQIASRPAGGFDGTGPTQATPMQARPAYMPKNQGGSIMTDGTFIDNMSPQQIANQSTGITFGGFSDEDLNNFNSFG